MATALAQGQFHFVLGVYSHVFVNIVEIKQRWPLAEDKPSLTLIQADDNKPENDLRQRKWECRKLNALNNPLKSRKQAQKQGEKE